MGMKAARELIFSYSKMNYIVSVFFMLFIFQASTLMDIHEESMETINVPKVYVNYKFSRQTRSIDESIYSPLRFHIHVEDTVTKNPNELKLLVEKATSRVSQLLSVSPVYGPLLLERTACGSRWSHGLNRGRCSSVRPQVKKEVCGNTMDSFLIPDEHLDGLEVFNFKGKSPIYSIPTGKGVNADYALYVTTTFSSWCQKGDVIAHAFYCRLDQHNRPIAGFINFCPIGLQKQHMNSKHFSNVIIHEIFHALGFSKNLFPEFQGCFLDYDNSQCGNMKYIVADKFNVSRLIFPTVVQSMQKHFSCDLPEFGAPLQLVNSSHTSHWDPFLMHRSIMNPDLNDLDEAVIDPITLSVFADSGWYKVNFSAADKYTWGRGQGCDFGMTENCSNLQEFCDFKTQSISCSFHKAAQVECQQVDPFHKCGIWKLRKSCRFEEMEHQGEHFHHLQCALVQKDKNIDTICTAYSCQSDDIVSYLIDDSWVMCPSGQVVLHGDKEIFCPIGRSFCSKNFSDYEIEFYDLQSNKGSKVLMPRMLLVMTLLFSSGVIAMLLCCISKMTRTGGFTEVSQVHYMK